MDAVGWVMGGRTVGADALPSTSPSAAEGCKHAAQPHARTLHLRGREGGKAAAVGRGSIVVAISCGLAGGSAGGALCQALQ